jgi:hypothetical protein
MKKKKLTFGVEDHVTVVFVVKPAVILHCHGTTQNNSTVAKHNLCME